MEDGTGIVSPSTALVASANVGTTGLALGGERTTGIGDDSFIRRIG